MPSSSKPLEPTKLQKVHFTFPSKTIYMEEIFHDINRQMLEFNYTLNIRQLIKIVQDLKKYPWQKLKVDRPHINIKSMNENATTFVVLDFSTIIDVIDNHMAIIQIQIVKTQLMMYSEMGDLTCKYYPRIIKKLF
jgi:hypothetical protein